MATATSSPSKEKPIAETKPDAPLTTESTSAKKRKGVDQSKTKLLVKLLSENARLPIRGSSMAAGYDLSSAQEVSIAAKGRGVVKTDLAIALPEGTYGRIAPRSGLAVKAGIDVGGGVIDADYRGAVSVVLFNHGDDDFESSLCAVYCVRVYVCAVKIGDRVAQLVIEVITTPEVEEVKELEETHRGEGGFGSTGVATDVTNTMEKRSSKEDKDED